MSGNVWNTSNWSLFMVIANGEEFDFPTLIRRDDEGNVQGPVTIRRQLLTCHY